MRVGILGAVVSGLSIGKMLSKHFDVEILERSSLPGGIARTRDVNGISYNIIGGHCFNSKYPDVLKFVFEAVLPEDQWHKITRDTVISLRDMYPVEGGLKSRDVMGL